MSVVPGGERLPDRGARAGVPERRRGGRLPELAVGPRLGDLRQRPQPIRRLRAARMGDPWFAAIVVLWGAGLAAVAASGRWQLLISVVAVAGFALLYLQWPVIGTGLLFGLWTVAPLVRRLLDLAEPTAGADLLSVTPFLATAALALVAFRRHPPPPAVRLAVGLVLLGFGFGVVTGLAAPAALAYGVLAYGSGVLALFIGYANGRERRFTFEALLLPLVLVSSVYGVYQGLAPRLPSWDQFWLFTNSFGSVGTKEGGNFRVFSILNSPYTYATLVAVWLAVLFVSRRVTPLRLVTVLVALVGLFLTQSRGAWVAVVGGLLLLTFFTGGRAIVRLAALGATLVGMYLALGSTPAGTSVVQRAQSVSAGTADKSGADRLTAIRTLAPPALARPLGAGLGSVGAAADLNPAPTASLVDNGYLIVLVQVGPFGWLLIAAGIARLVWLVVRRTSVEMRRALLPLLAPVGVYVPLSLFSETLYGLAAVILFYALGEALGRREDMGDAPPKTAFTVPVAPRFEPASGARESTTERA